MTHSEQAIRNYLKQNHYNRFNLRAALIDMDGVLYDSMKNHTLAWKQFADSLGIEATREEFYLYEGMTGAATIRLLFQRQFQKEVTPEEAKELYKIKAENFRNSGRVEMMPGAHDMLSCLKNNNIERVLVTGSGQVDMLKRLDVEYAGLFEPNLRISAADVKHGKPNPEPYLMAQKRVSTAPGQCIVIENAPLGVKAGHDSGAFTIAITTGPIPRQRLIENGADLVFGSMQEFADYLPTLINEFKCITIE